jgi:hypothetical protein
VIKAQFYSIFFILLFSCLSSFSQTKNELERQRKKLKKEIAQAKNRCEIAVDTYNQSGNKTFS